MKKIYLFSALFLMFAVSTTAQRNFHSPKKRPIMTEFQKHPDRPQITQEVTPIHFGGVINFTQLAEEQKANPPKPKRRFIEQGEDLDGNYSWQGKPGPKPDVTYQVPGPAGGEKHLINSPAPLGHWTGTTDNGTLIPPDIRVAAGPTYVMETTNQEFTIWNKTGTLISTLNIDNFYNGSGGQSGSYFDPHIVYDPNYQKWVVIIDGNISNGRGGIMIAVSQTNDPTGTWWRYSFDGTGNTNDLLDYPLLGYNTNWVVVTANDFINGGGTVAGKIYVMNRASLYSGTLANLNTFTDNNAFVWAPAQTQDIGQTIEYMVMDANGGNGTDQVGSITGTPTAPVYNAGTTFAVSSTWDENAVGATQQGNGNAIESGDTRIGNAVVINGSMYFCQTVFLPTGNPTRDAVQWMQINPATRAVQQFGRVDDATGAMNYYYGAINVNSNGDILLGHCRSGTASYASACYSFHATTDAANTMQSVYIYKPGVAGYFKDFGSGRNRWGDFTGASVDPSDGSFFGAGEWAGTGNTWETEIVHVNFSAPITVPPVADFTEDLTTTCIGTVHFTDISTNNPTSWLWNFGDGSPTSTLQNPTHTYLTAGTYSVSLTATNAYGSNTKTYTDLITVTKPAPPAVVGGSHCGTGTVTLSATSTDVIKWYANIGDTTPVFTGNPFVTPSLSATTVYYAEDIVPGSAGTVGPANENVLGQGGYYANATDRYLMFDALSAFTLVSVVVDAQAAGVRTIELRNSGGGVLQTISPNLPAGVSTVTLNFPVAIGTGYELAINGTANLFRNNAGGANNFYPFTLAGVVSITGSNAGAGYYYYFYNWTVRGPGCASSRAADTARITNGLSTSLTSTNVLCNGGATGTATITVTNGTTPYTYNWSSGATTATATNLIAAIYTVTATDAAGCSATASRVITQPIQIIIQITPTAAGCGSPNGSAASNITGGTGAYAYAWSTGATTANISNLAAGNYALTIHDANNCSSTATTTVGSGSSLTDSHSAVAVMCFGQNTGSATVTPTSGTSPYTYVWSNGGTAATINNIAAGTYYVTITDASSCVKHDTVTVTQPASAVNVTTGSTQAGCGLSNGSATGIAQGGTIGYTYSWSNGGTTSTISNIAAGTYTLTVHDANNCSSTASATVVSGTTITGIHSSVNVSCFGSNTGSATVTPTSGTSPYTYVWSNGGTTATISNVAAGTYYATITDMAGCTKHDTVTLTQPSSAVNVSVTPINAGCGLSNGSATAQAFGGTAGYTFSWSSGATTFNISNLAAGTYSLTVTDANSCTVTASATISNTSTLGENHASTPTSCFGGSNGSATVFPAGGTTPYTYLWSGGETTSSISGIAAGNYTVTITDGTGCQLITTIPVTSPSAISISLTSQNAGCGQSNGIVSSTVSGGTSGYSYLWSNGGTSAGISNLGAGIYSVTITDANSCTSSASANVSNPTSFTETHSSSNITCNGSGNGTATLNVTGGAPPITYMWSNGSTSSSVSSLNAGTYFVTITDGNNCQKIDTVAVSEPGQLLVTGNNNDVLCFGDATGAAAANVTGGTPGYSYIWTNGSTTNPLTGLTAGTYFVTVTDANNCTTTASETINQPQQLQSSMSTINETNSQSNGSATANPTGGTAPYTYSWSNGGNTQTISSLGAGTYFVTITDANGCTLLSSATVSNITGIANVSANISFTLSPNPASNQLTVSMTLPAQNITLSLKDVLGQTLVNKAITAQTTTIDLSLYANGVYFIVVKQGDKQAVKQFVISK